jgi:hypothetical protein
VDIGSACWAFGMCIHKIQLLPTPKQTAWLSSFWLPKRKKELNDWQLSERIRVRKTIGTDNRTASLQGEAWQVLGQRTGLDVFKNCTLVHSDFDAPSQTIHQL